MRVLVVVPAQLGRPFLSEALESLSRQTRRADEIIVAIGQTPLHERLNDAINASDCDAFIVLCDDDLLCGNPVPLYLLRSEPGTRQDEKALHRRFERFHIRGEWFYPEVWSFL